jgi:hypothetical protein
MSNTFYYFFSATPQVLAAIMVMFGVLIMYKITAIRTALIGHGQIIVDALKINPSNAVSSKHTTSAIIASIQNAIVMKEIPLLSYYIAEMDKISDPRLMTVVQLYDARRRALLHIIRMTIIMTFVSSVTIIISLWVIPFGEKILCRISLLYSLFIGIGILLVSCCVFYAYILALCLDIKDLYYSPIKGNTPFATKPNFFKFLFTRIK